MKQIVLLALLAACPTAYATSYPATVDRVIDGDTIVAYVDVWPQLTMHVSVRLDGINSPETRTRDLCEKKLGIQATNWVKVRVAPGDRVTVGNVQLGKFAGRVVARVMVDGVDLSDAQVAAGLAHVYDGGTRQPFCRNGIPN